MLCCVVLYCVVLCCVVLCCAVLCCAVLCCVLRCAVLCCVALCCVVLSCVVLSCPCLLSCLSVSHHVRVRVGDAGLGLKFPKEWFLQFIALLDPVPVDILNNLGLGLGSS